MDAMAEQQRLQALKDEQDARQRAIDDEIQRQKDEEKAAIEAAEAERLRLEEIEAENEEKRLQAIADAEDARMKAEEMARRE